MNGNIKLEVVSFKWDSIENIVIFVNQKNFFNSWTYLREEILILV